MTRQANVWAGTALALLMASAQAVASPAIVPRSPDTPSATLVQDQPSEEELRRKQQEQEAEPEPAPAEPALQPEAAPQPEVAPEPAPQPEAAPEQPATEEPSAEEPQPEAPSEAAPEKPAPADPAPEQPAAEQPPAEQAPAEEGPAGQPPAQETPQDAPAEQPPARQAPAEQPAEEAPAEQQPAQEAPSGQAPAQAQPVEPAPGQPDAPAPDAAPAEPAPVEQAPAGQAPAPADQAPVTPEQAPTPQETPAEPAPPAQPGAAPAEQPAQSGEAPAENAAPVLDSQKQPLPAQGGGEGQPAPSADQPQPAAPAAEAPRPAPAEPAAPPPTDDRAAQQAVAPVEVRPVTAEEGRRVERAPDIRRQERPEGADVLREIGDRVIIQLNNQVIVESNDRPRMSRGARDVYYEDLPRGRTRETIVRENGVQVVTIRNRYGDVVRRSRIAPDGTEYILSYVDDEAYEERGGWRDPGDDLPPMVLTIPVEDYILDAERVEDPDLYYEFLDQPPVEAVERLYSVDEVKRSARVRDKTRRVDLDTVTFEFGSASIVEREIPRLQGVADAMEKLLAKNPAETFLIEGHTDAVGSDVANLALSDRRAEAVAEALANVFGIPPENLTTQGYGEQYLKVRTEEPERENRRVAIRRITALVAPVASAN